LRHNLRQDWRTLNFSYFISLLKSVTKFNGAALPPLFDLAALRTAIAFLVISIVAVFKAVYQAITTDGCAFRRSTITSEAILNLAFGCATIFGHRVSIVALLLIAHQSIPTYTIAYVEFAAS
jgi:hypothetical protein